jgi:phage tail-like protein
MAKTGTRRDPFPVYCFRVTLDALSGDASAFFKSVSGLKYETEVTDYQEGGQNKFTHRLVGATKWSNLVLKRGFARSFELMQWRQDWINGEFKRSSGEIAQLDTKLDPVCVWKFEGGWPCKWELSEFDASKSELSIETLEIAHHGLTFVEKK